MDSKDLFKQIGDNVNNNYAFFLWFCFASCCFFNSCIKIAEFLLRIHTKHPVWEHFENFILQRVNEIVPLLNPWKFQCIFSSFKSGLSLFQTRFTILSEIKFKQCYVGFFI